MWHPNICLVIWQIGDLVFVNNGILRGVGIILRLCKRKNTEWYEVLIDGEITSVMHYEFKPLNEVTEADRNNPPLFPINHEMFYGGSNWHIDQTRLYHS